MIGGRVMLMNDLRELQSDPARFRERLLIPSAHGAKPLGEIAADFQTKDFAVLDRSFLAVSQGRKPEPGRIWIERTKGCSKDGDLSAMLLWLLAFSPRSLTCQAAAADLQQADELRKSARAILRLNGWLDRLIEIQANAIVNRHTDSRCDILTADASGSHGSRPDVLILNELTHIRDREFASTLMDNSSKMPSGLVVVATNAGFIGSWQEEWRTNAIESDRWHFSAFTSPAPWLDGAELKEARRRNSDNRYRRLWLGEWTGNSESAFEASLIEKAVKLQGPLSGPVPGWSFAAGIDIGLTRDSTAVVVLAKHTGQTIRKPSAMPIVSNSTIRAMCDIGLMDELPQPEDEVTIVPGTGRLMLAHLCVWKPENGEKIDLEAVEREILAIHRRFKLQRLAADPWQAELLMQRLGRQNIPTSLVPFTPSNLQSMASGMLDAFREGNVDLYRDETLIADLKQLRLEERAYGYRLTSPRGADGDGTAHGDAATALQLALHAARGLRSESSYSQRSLVYSY